MVRLHMGIDDGSNLNFELSPIYTFNHMRSLWHRPQYKTIFSYFSTKTYVVGTQENRLNETVLLSTQKTCLNRWIRKLSQFLAQIFAYLDPWKLCWPIYQFIIIIILKMLIFIICARLNPLPALITFSNSLDNSRFETLTVFLKVYFKGDISRFFIFHCKFLLYVGFNVFIKNPDHFPQCSVIKWV